MQSATQTKMTDENNVEHLSVVMTTQAADDVIQATADNAVRSSSSTTRDIEFYFQCAVIVIGVVGTAANALILYALIVSKQHKKNVLIFHQNVLDFISSLLLVIAASLKVAFFYSGSTGYWFCALIESEYINWVAILASKTNLISVTVERYLKVVYAVWSKKKPRNWMLYLAMAFAWVSGFAVITASNFTTTNVIGGKCLVFTFWKSKAALTAYRIFYFFYFYVVILVIFILCYWHILVVIRRQARVMASHSAAGPISTIAQAQSQKIQTNVVKTMLLVSACFAICDLPIHVYFIILLSGIRSEVTDVVYHASVFTLFFYICGNPFIYAVKFDPVKRVLLGMIPCKKASVEPAESIQAAAARHTTDKYDS